MKLNRSLAISAKFKEFQKANILGLLMEAFPKIEIEFFLSRIPCLQ